MGTEWAYYCQDCEVEGYVSMKGQKTLRDYAELYRASERLVDGSIYIELHIGWPGDDGETNRFLDKHSDHNIGLVGDDRGEEVYPLGGDKAERYESGEWISVSEGGPPVGLMGLTDCLVSVTRLGSYRVAIWDSENKLWYMPTNRPDAQLAELTHVDITDIVTHYKKLGSNDKPQKRGE